MAVAYRSSTSTNSGAATAGSIVITVPSGVQIHDSLIAAIAVDGSASTITPPAGWTLLRNSNNATVGARSAVYWRLADGTEPATYTWNLDSSRFVSGAMLSYSGANVFVPPSNATTNTTAASTTINGSATNTTYEAGVVLQIMLARNATAASTLTPGGSFVEREDTCTTATTFINLEVQDIAKGLPMNSSTASNATCSQTAQGICNTVFLEELRPTFNVIGEDEFSVNSIAAANTTMTTLNFQTTGYNEVILACVAINKDTNTVTSITHASLTFVNVTRANTNAGSMEVWRAFAPIPIAPSTITINFASSVSVNAMVAGFIGADFTGTNGSGAIGNTNTGSTTAAAASITLTTTRNNSWVFAAASQGNATASTITAGTAQTVLRSQNDTVNVCASWVWRQNSLTPASGTVVTMNCTAPTTGNCNMVTVELLPAVIKNFGALGVG
jgi:hypothetical protein